MLGKLKKIKKRWYLIVGIILVLLLVVLGSNANKSSVASKPYRVEKMDLKKELSLSGEINAHARAVLVFESVGKLAFVKVKEGDVVKKGQLIAGLDTTELKAAALTAYYRYSAADANAKQVEDSVKGHDGDETFSQKNQRVTAQTARDIAYDNWQISEKNLRDATLFSPINGVVVRVTSPQAGVFIASPVAAEFDIVDPNTIYFSAVADQNDVVSLKNGLGGEIVLDSFTDKKIPTTIESIGFSPKAGETGTVYEVSLKLVNDDGLEQYRLGMTGDVNFVLEELKGVIALPQKYVKTENGKKYVFLGINKVKTEVEVGDNYDGNIEIKSGLKEGETVYDQAI